jgi:tetratricopeptide (TPR) repeat protein
VNTAEALDSRGLVWLRRGEYDRAIADYDEALKARPNSAWSLYGRGLAKLKKGLKAEGEADLGAAARLDPHVPERAKAFGVS